jgi:hypothetical protein
MSPRQRAEYENKAQLGSKQVCAAQVACLNPDDISTMYSSGSSVMSSGTTSSPSSLVGPDKSDVCDHPVVHSQKRDDGALSSNDRRYLAVENDMEDVPEVDAGLFSSRAKTFPSSLDTNEMVASRSEARASSPRSSCRPSGAVVAQRESTRSLPRGRKCNVDWDILFPTEVLDA